jgi:polyphosphate kinase 2 (PPK2 family)
VLLIFSGHGRRWQRRRHQARDVWRQSARLRGFNFKRPSTEELKHDFLCTIRRLPERGRTGIFNRSYYEEY